MFTEHDRGTRWMSAILILAAAYNVTWGSMVVAWPGLFFDWAGMPQPSYPELWQCIGMIVGVYGLAYGAAAMNPLRHWPVVLAGLAGKILGPIGFLNAALHARFPWKFGWLNVTNDLIWWIPFGLILLAAYHASLDRQRIASPEIQQMALRAKSQEGMTLLDMSARWPLLMVFLRHTGCTFCREALADIAEQRKQIEATGTRIVLVHMSSDERVAGLFKRYGLDDLPRVSDPDRSLYRAFGLVRGSIPKLFGPKVWWRGFQSVILEGHGQGMLEGDGFQMPGVFLVYHGAVIRSYHHQTAADRPDYVNIASLHSVTA